MASEDEDKEGKTLDPTEHRLREALKEGRTPLSRELGHLAFLAAFLINSLWLIPYLAPSSLRTLSLFLGPLQDKSLDVEMVGRLSRGVIYSIAPIVLSLLGSFALLVWGFGLAQSYKAISAKLLAPKFSRLSFKEGFKKNFSGNALIEFIKTLIKAICLIGIIIYITRPIAWTQMLYWAPVHIKHALSTWLIEIFVGLFAALAAVVIADIFYQRWKHRKDLRMSHRDVKDEHKETEGNPEIKQKRRQLMGNRKRTLAAIPEATVVIMNPTHYAVALKWNEEEMEAPTVIAKGLNELALRMKDVARENKVPVVENPPLARALFDQVDEGKEIPPEHYQAVANIIRWISQLGR